MADHRYRPSGSGRRSPTFNPARASLPVGVGYNSLYNGDLHAVPTGRYDAAVPRRTGDHHHRPATTTITTYNVTKEPISRTTSLRDPSRTRHRSSTIDTGSVKPIIVTTNHSRPHNSNTPSTHTSSSTSRRPESPSRDPYRSSEETYYTQPASSIRSRSHQRHHSANYEQDDFYRMRERMGGNDRLHTPARPHSRQGMYANNPRASATGFAEDYEYTKPSDLARYDLDHDRPRSRAGRRDSFDRGANYYRPSVNVVTNEVVSRPERRAPPTSGALDRYNKNAAAGIYERGSVAMPALPPSVPAAPPVDPARRSGLLDPPASPSVDRRSSTRPRPISLYQDPAPRTDDLSYRPRDESVLRDRRERDRGEEIYRDDAVASRGFGLRPELLDQGEHRRPIEPERRDFDEHRSRRDYEPREPKRRSDEDLDKLRGRHELRPSEARERPRVEESRERKDNKGDKMRDKVVAGLGVAAAAIGLGAGKEKEKEEKDVRVSPRRRRDSELAEPEPLGSRAADRYKPRDADIERRSSPREDPVVVERRGSPKERSDRREESVSRDREREREKERERERERDREREKERQREKERERERERDREREREREIDRERDRSRRDTEAKLTGVKSNTRDVSPHSDDSAAGASRRRHRASTFDPTDTKGLMDLKAELAAIDHEKPKEKERPTARGREAETVIPAGPDRQTASGRERSRGRDDSRSRHRDESRSRELALVDAEQKQVRVVSPPRDKKDEKPIKGILKQPTSQFPEENNPVREGVAPHKDDKTKKDVPQGARWTKINRRMVNPEALTIGKERFEVRDDFVIVLRVLSKEEIQAYATATAQLREMRRKEHERDQGDRDSDDRGRERDEEDRRRRHRHRREEEEGARDRDADRDRDRHRRQRRDDEVEKPLALEYDDHSRHHHQRSYRDRDLETIASSTDDRR
ncbi:hypothetical protein BKA67DRAFT_663437 [Truncatella angustata]|uniref:DUF8035 domain-containing protein n=1 Tax=Truncatella angustata TaxID=152316 RepID=A0A9P8UD40_9PEZI|nr:uncharacterized protein BKA67DRAFT_663437 [Truncatella angustata]KAH6647090.1 hypothetical protein BKA67DRAFT_663437 [Truncatella angustata]